MKKCIRCPYLHPIAFAPPDFSRNISRKIAPLLVEEAATAQERQARSLGVTVRTISMGYDNDGRMTSISDPSASYTMTYDAADRLYTIANTGTPGMPQVTLTMGYDSRHNVTSVARLEFFGRRTWAQDYHRVAPTLSAPKGARP